MTAHDLKILPEYFEKVNNGSKLVELRYNDRDYQVGDQLHLQEYVPATQTYTGKSCLVEVTDITVGEPWLSPGYVALSIRRIEELERISAFQRLYEAAAKRQTEWYESPRNEFEQALDDLARLEMRVKIRSTGQ